MFTTILEVIPAFEKPAQSSDLASQVSCKIAHIWGRCDWEQEHWTGCQPTVLLFPEHSALVTHCSSLGASGHASLHNKNNLKPNKEKTPNKQLQKNKRKKKTKKNPHKTQNPEHPENPIVAWMKARQNQTDLSSNGLRLEWSIFHLVRVKVI